MLNENIIKEFGLRIKQLRIDRNFSQEELSYRTGFHRTYVGMVERGERNISLSNIVVFSKVFEMNLSELFNFQSNSLEHSYKIYKTKLDS